MNAGRVNLFQSLMRRWEVEHPCNAAQVMELAVPFYDNAERAAWSAGWAVARRRTGLGRLIATATTYRFSADGLESIQEIPVFDEPWAQHVSVDLNRSFDEGSDPFRPFLARSVSGDLAAGLVYRHWIADSVSIRELMQQWLLAVHAPMLNRRRPLPLPTNGYWASTCSGRGQGTLLGAALSVIRRQTRLRRVMKVASTGLSDRRTASLHCAVPATILKKMHTYTRHSNATFGDVLLGALAVACRAMIPLQTRPRRTDLAVGSIVDLRTNGAPSFGLLLGYLTAVCRPVDLQSFDELVSRIHRQTAVQKRDGIAACSMVLMAAAKTLGRLTKPGELYHFYRKDFPLAGGISSVDLRRTWVADWHPRVVHRYARVSPTGPMTPVVFTATTLGESLDVGLTYRTGLLSPEQADALARRFIDTLDNL